MPPANVGKRALAQQLVSAQNGFRYTAELGPLVISDEVYRGLSYTGEADPSILQVQPDAVALSSFSKAYSMTGWRLGHTIVPENLLAKVKLIQQDGFVCANTFVQWAAIEAVQRAEEIIARPRTALRRCRDTSLAELERLGFLAC